MFKRFGTYLAIGLLLAVTAFPALAIKYKGDLESSQLSTDSVLRFDAGGTQTGRFDTTGWILGTLDGAGDGPLHIFSGSAGSVTADPNSSELVLESSENNFGLTGLGHNTSSFKLRAGRPSNNLAGEIIFSHADNRWLFNIINAERLRLDTAENVFNEGGLDVNTRIEGDTDPFLGFFDASLDAVGIGASSIDAAAKLQIDSTTKGLLGPRMTGAERDAITSPPNGLQLYNTTSEKWNVRENGAWSQFTSGGGEIVAETVQATTSGTAFDFTSLPANIQRITIILEQLSWDGGDGTLIQIGDSGGIEATGYDSDGSTSSSNLNSSTGFVVFSNTDAHLHDTIITLTRIDGNKWVEGHAGHRDGGNLGQYGGGRKELSGELDRVRLTRTGTNNADSGLVNVFYEF
jgi:hypothetical protein